MAINWGEVINEGFGILQEKLGKKNSPPPPPASAGGTASKIPAWVWPVVIIGVLLFGKKLFK